VIVSRLTLMPHSLNWALWDATRDHGKRNWSE
jgi:hypothetical protein